MATQRRFALVTATSAAALLALSGCGLFVGDDDSADDTATPETTTTQTEEATQSPEPTETETSSPSPTATETSTSASGAPTDLTNSRVMGAMNGQTVDGVQVNAATASIMEASGYDIPALLQEAMGVVTVDPAQCSDPVQGSFMGGVMQSNVDESVVAADQDGSVIITVHTYDSVDEAETELQGFRDSTQDCEQATMALDGAAMDIELTDEEISVEDAETAITTTFTATGAGGSMDVHTGRMVYGNSVVTAISTSEYDGQRADYEAMLSEVAELLQDA
ncbi:MULTISPECIES: hypothetical protein [Kocuria]|uniref:PknH-like extracellular domain-containing protein n=1 Tax=Kocuria subflava TaxID=1736139 RepID=A0A846TS06_9MICC|nr:MULTISPECIES: hypothetical protein [Kocuria]NKE09740.1 hypothetical protein [Kocuria subflava]